MGADRPNNKVKSSGISLQNFYLDVADRFQKDLATVPTGHSITIDLTSERRGGLFNRGVGIYSGV